MYFIVSRVRCSGRVCLVWCGLVKTSAFASAKSGPYSGPGVLSEKTICTCSARFPLPCRRTFSAVAELDEPWIRSQRGRAAAGALHSVEIRRQGEAAPAHFEVIGVKRFL